MMGRGERGEILGSGEELKEFTRLRLAEDAGQRHKCGESMDP